MQRLQILKEISIAEAEENVMRRILNEESEMNTNGHTSRKPLIDPDDKDNDKDNKIKDEVKSEDVKTEMKDQLKECEVDQISKELNPNTQPFVPKQILAFNASQNQPYTSVDIGATLSHQVGFYFFVRHENLISFSLFSFHAFANVVHSQIYFVSFLV